MSLDLSIEPVEMLHNGAVDGLCQTTVEIGDLACLIANGGEDVCNRTGMSVVLWQASLVASFVTHLAYHLRRGTGCLREMAPG